MGRSNLCPYIRRTCPLRQSPSLKDILTNFAIRFRIVLDECLRLDPESRVACNTFVTMGLILVGGQITTTDQPRE